MTHPVQEPSTQRQVGGLDWRTRQLARRPWPPVEASSMPMCYFNWAEGGEVQTGFPQNPADLGGGTPYSDGWINNAGLTMTPEPFFFDEVDGSIGFASDGLYLAQFTAQWADTWAAGTRVYCSMRFQGTGPSAVGNFDVREPITNDTDETNNHSTAIFFQSDASQGQPDFISGLVMQESGSNKDLVGATLMVVRLQAYDIDDGEFFIWT